MKRPRPQRPLTLAAVTRKLERLAFAVELFRLAVFLAVDCSVEIKVL